jgi:ribonuclease PH
MPRKKQITLLQMDGELTPKEIKEIIKNVLKAGQVIYEKQKKTLKEKYEEVS